MLLSAYCGGGREEGFPEKKGKKQEKLVSEKFEGRGFRKTHKKTSSVCFVAILEVKRSLSVRRPGKVGFPHLWYIESLFCYKWFSERQRSPAENHIIIRWPVRRDAHVCLDHCDDVTGEAFPRALHCTSGTC